MILLKREALWWRLKIAVRAFQPEMKEQIFNPFVTTKKSGVGLGLAIVSKIVDAHGGSLKLVSEPGHGACFRIEFPVADSERGAKN